MSSTTAEEALMRAKAIAARLTGGSTNGGQSQLAGLSTGNLVSPAAAATSADQASPTTSTTTKRKRWGVAPAAISSTGNEALPGLADAAAAAKKAKMAGSEETSKKVWVRTTRERGAAHFKAYFADRLGNLEKELNEGKPKDDAQRVTLQLKGRGSSSEPPLPGMPEEPLHILITGMEAAIQSADAQVDTLLVQAEEAPVEAVDPEEVQAALRKENHEMDHSTALTVTGTGFSNSGYRPATVAQLISNNPIHSAMNSGDLIEETVDVPNGIVGYLIGRGGETISSMQARSGCKVQIQKEHELTPGQTHRVITLQAATQDAIDQCRGMIESMVEDRIRAAGGSMSMGGGNSKDAKVQEALAAGHALVQVKVPDADVGLIIGKGGATIKAIQDQTGAQVQIPPSGSSADPDTRTISITHPTEEGANMAKRRIEDLLNSKPSFSNQFQNKSSGPQITIQVMIPDRDVGLCIGRQGCVIREMQQKTGTRIQIPSQPTPGQTHRVATVTGSQEGCNQVQGFIDRIVNEQSSASVMSGTPMQQNYYQQQGQGNNNSAEWQAYYAAQAVAQQQSQQQQPPQQQQAHAPAPAAQAVAPAADAYYEQFFRYAYYYGEPAARQYYGAWSPAPGTPNPYGVNPNGVSPAPAPAGAPAAAPAPAAPAPAPPQQMAHRDTSVRKVSNLPAWMTRGN